MSSNKLVSVLNREVNEQETPLSKHNVLGVSEKPEVIS